ncbi:alpha/beta fold hydrolase [Kitasatospora sp. NPDC058965]|uniref:alpha/beta fold hydrolase n=1 Tax=Kitasatospora sp. NPDC058965 TaxID=3346682 RepID=UPI00368D7F61
MRTDLENPTAFVLVSGPFTGAPLWEEVGERLWQAGAEVHAAALTGPGAGTDVDLDTHVEDLVRLIDGVAAPTVVLVGHDYGLYPLLGAAQQRVARVTRIVYLDTGLPQDGEPALAMVPDPATQALLRERPDAPVPVPAPDEWQRWGNTTGLTRSRLEQLSALGAPQHGRTLTQPLRLTGALTGVPTSGILCTAGGMTVDGVQQLVSSGMPQFRPLADPSVGFFELATGHWPMLSLPDELAATLLAAAAGEGRRLTPPPASTPFYERPFVLETAEVPRVRTGRVDLHLPDADGPRPAVLFVHGGPLPRDAAPSAREWPLYVGHARHAASQGLVGAVLEHRLHALTDYPTAAADLAEAVELLRADPRVDGDRIALWFFSGGSLLMADQLAAPAPWLRCVAASYPVLAPLPGWAGVEPRFRPAAVLPKAGRLPVVLSRAGLEAPGIAATVAAFLDAAADCGAAVELVDVPHGRHGFDCEEPTEESVAAARQALAAVLAHLRD